MLDQLGPRRENREILSGGMLCADRGRDLGGGECGPKPRNTWSHQKPEETGRILP